MPIARACQHFRADINVGDLTFLQSFSCRRSWGMFRRSQPQPY